VKRTPLAHRRQNIEPGRFLLVLRLQPLERKQRNILQEIYNRKFPTPKTLVPLEIK